jgi:hypothetical protein
MDLELFQPGKVGVNLTIDRGSDKNRQFLSSSLLGHQLPGEMPADM